MIKIIKIQSIRIIKIQLLLTKKNPNLHGTLHAPSDSSITSLSSLSLFCFCLPSLQYLHLLDLVAQEVQSSTGEYSSIFDCQITTFILATHHTVGSSNRPQILISYAGIYHFSPGSHRSMLWCEDCLLK